MKFTPGTLGGEAVSVRMTVPITFKIPEMEEMPDDSLYTEVDQIPELIGGLRDLQQRVRYPTSALVHGVQGNVIVSFVVDEEGTVSERRISGSVSYAIAQAAMEAVTQSSFTPGIKDGKPVKVKMTMPVTFRITPGSMPLAPVGYGLMMCGSRTPLHTLPNGGTNESGDGNSSQEEYVLVERLPTLGGGMRKLQRRVKYPDSARRDGVQEEVLVAFVVDTNGKVLEPTIKKSLRDDCDAAVLEASRGPNSSLRG